MMTACERGVYACAPGIEETCSGKSLFCMLAFFAVCIFLC